MAGISRMEEEILPEEFIQMVENVSGRKMPGRRAMDWESY